MNRWLASRWMVLTVLFGVAALWLSWYLRDASAFTAIGSVGLGGGWGHNAMGKWTSTQQTTSYEPVPLNDVPMGTAYDEDVP